MSSLISIVNKWSKQYDIRPHCCHTWMVQSYSPSDANMHSIQYTSTDIHTAVVLHHFEYDQPSEMSRHVLGWRLFALKINVRTDSTTEFGSNPILIVQICKALDRTIDFNECVTAFTTGRACTPSSDMKGGYCLVAGTTPIGRADAADTSRDQ